MPEKDKLADDVTHESYIRLARQLKISTQVGFSSSDIEPVEWISWIQIRHFSFTTQKWLCRQVDRRDTLAERTFFPPEYQHTIKSRLHDTTVYCAIVGTYGWLHYGHHAF